MDEIVTDFMLEEVKIGKEHHEFSEMLDVTVTVLHSNKFKKPDDYIQRRDFTLIRNVLYSYSTTAKNKILANKYYARLFHHFYQVDGAKFVASKSKNKPKLFEEDLQTEFDELNRIACQTINNG